MHVDLIDQYHSSESRIHILDPRVKVLAAVGLILSNAVLPDGSWLAFASTWLVLLVVNELADLGLGFTLKRSLIALPFALVAVSAIFAPIGNPLGVWDLGFIKLVPTDAGLIRFLSIMLRSWLSVQAAILLVATTQFPDLIHALEHLRLPKTLTTIIAFLFRYLFVLTNEVFRVIRARDSRSAGLPGAKTGGKLSWRIKTTGSMAGQLFTRSYERSDRIYQAMVARGYTGHIRTMNPHQMDRTDWLSLLYSAAVIVVIQLVGWIR
ncbi:MAG: cobalt ECF transporter T component CbiQ [Anaerolineales bacterium]|jgi:cobalt/nickel transport system permease protein